MNTCAQPAEGAGGSRSQAAGELTLGLMSGEKRRGVGCSAFALLWERACSRRRPDRRRYNHRRTNPANRPVGRPPRFAFAVYAPREAERRFCAVGSVGASLLAKNLRAPRGARLPASSLTSIASKLAPTGRAPFRFSKVTRCKSGTARGRDRSNWICTPVKNTSPNTKPSRASPPQGSSVARGPMWERG
jgi:hypothetical protein